MNKTLTQKVSFQTTVFSIEDTGLLIIQKAKQGETELHFPFEQIKTNKATVLDHNKGALTLAFAFAGIALFAFILGFIDKTIESMGAHWWLMISIILFIVYFKTKRKKIYLQTNENKIIEFHADKSNLHNVTIFIEQLLIERNTYLVSRYGNLNRNLEFGTQLDNLNWLLNSRAISKVQYDEKIQELNALFNGNTGSKPIGFSPHN